LFLRESTICKNNSYVSVIINLSVKLLIVTTLHGCTTTGQSYSEERSTQASAADQYFTLPQVVSPDDPVYSVQLHPSKQPNTAPFLELNSSDRLTLRFESLGFESRSYQISFTHHNPDWSESGLSPDQYLTGFEQHEISGGIVSRSSQPYYRSFSYSFPNQNIGFRVSGNYLLHIHNRNTGELEFSLPFFVYENEGSITSSTEVLRSARFNQRVMHSPVSRYILPDFVDQPQFDLTFYYSQNQFWGRRTEAQELDFSNPNEVQFELSFNRPFFGEYEFRVLNLNNVDQLSRSVLDVDKSAEPWKVTLRDESEGFTQPITVGVPQNYGPETTTNSNYLEVEFRFDTEYNLNENQEIYLVGDFNSWKISQEHRLNYDENLGRWISTIIMKEGTYRYKYVLVENGTMDDLAFDTLFPDNQQEYHAFVYFRDINLFYHRLLQVNTFYKASR
jgi:hypothetical protein